MSKVWAAYTGALGTVTSVLSTGLGRQGRAVARRPVTAIGIMLVIIFASCAGWARIHGQSKSEKLWVPQHSDAMHYREYVGTAFGATERGALFYASVKPGPGAAAAAGGNVLQLEATWEAFQLHEAIMAISVAVSPSWPAGSASSNVSFADICYRNYAGVCAYTGYLQFWGSNFTSYLATVGGSVADPSAGNRSILQASVNTATFPDRSPVVPLSVFGAPDIVADPSSATGLQISGAQVLSMGYGVDKVVPDSVGNAWFDAYLDLLESSAASSKYITLDFISQNSVDKEVARSVSGDIKLIAISICVFITVGVLLLTSWDRVFTRTSLAIMGVIVVVLGEAAAYGVTMLIGLPFTSLEETLPFILNGIGLDVIFILVKGLDELDYHQPGLSLEQRFQRLMETAGLSVLVVSITNVVAFGLGAITEIPAIHWFCIYATMCVTANFIVLSVLFLAIFVLSERRMAANRLDCLCCITSSRPLVKLAPSKSTGSDPGAAPTTQEVITTGVAAPTAAAPASHSDIASRALKAHRNPIRRFIADWYTPFLLRWPVRIAVLAIFFGFLGVSIVGIFKVEQGQPLEDLCPDGSYVIPFQAIKKATFNQQIGDNSHIFFRGIDQSAPASQAAMFQALNLTLHTPYVNASVSAFEDNWLLAFIPWVEAAHPEVALTADGCFNPYAEATIQAESGLLAGLVPPATISGCVPQDRFTALLVAWLNTPAGSQNFDHLVLAANGTILASELGFVHTAPGDQGDYTLQAIHHMQDTEAAVNAQLFSDGGAGPDSRVFFVYSNNYIFWAGDAYLPKAALDFAIYAVVGVGFVLLFLLVHPVAMLLMMASVAMVVVFLYGELWILKLRFNSVSVVNMIMATGLAVDYSVYFAHKFMGVSGGTREERVLKAMSHTGYAVFLGGFTALVGTIPLAFASSKIIRTFFALIFGTILFSMLVGLCFLPVAFSIAGPARIGGDAASQQAADLPLAALSAEEEASK